MNETSGVIVKGFIGTATPVAGIAVSTLNTVELWLRIISLVVGISVGLVTLWKLRKKKD